MPEFALKRMRLAPWFRNATKRLSKRLGMSIMTASAWLAILSGIPIGLQLGATGTGGGILAVPMMV